MKRFAVSGTIKTLGVLALVAVAYWFGRKSEKPVDATGSRTPASQSVAADEAPSQGEEAKKPTIWTCSMHPQIRMPKPGKCPICGMTLIPLESGSEETGPRTLVMSKEDMKLAEIATSPVEEKFVTAEIRMVGKIDYDETRVRTISARFPGRLDRLYVDYTGVAVQKGDHLVQIYSPELLIAQEELIEAHRRLSQNHAQSSNILRRSDQRALKSSREKLRLWGLDEDQIRQIEERATVVDHIQINSPIAGVVVKKNRDEGDYVKEGTLIYTVADLSWLWIQSEAYESDLPWLRFGQEAEIEVEAYPGEIFHGRIAFIDPVVNPMTRTINMRINIENADGRLKPDMFVHTMVHSSVARGGRVMDSHLVGKWIGPMHPEIVRDEPGLCPVCGMSLIKAEDLGYVRAGDDVAKPLVVPASAVMRTGKRAVVYVEKVGAKHPTFDGREVVLGPRAGDYYLVRSGLEKGERVVTNGNFKIDSALQIQAKPSMMSSSGEPPEAQAQVSPAFVKALSPVYEAYLAVQAQLAEDKFPETRQAMGRLADSAGAVDMTLAEGEAHMQWMKLAESLRNAAGEGAEASSLEAARKAFGAASLAVIELDDAFGHAEDAVYHQVFCPMALDSQGARWIQTSKQIANPYLGLKMPSCGTIKRSNPAQ